MKFLYLLIFTLFLTGSNLNSQIQTLILQPDAIAGKDALVWTYYPNTNTGTNTEFVVYAWTKNGIPTIMRSFLEFDLSSIPANAIVDSARLFLYNYAQASSTNGQHSQLSGPNNMLVQRVIDPWNELTITYNNQPQTTTQNQVLTPPSTGPNQDFEIPVTQLVQFMVSNPNINYGFGLKMQVESYYRSLVFGSSDIPDSTRRPKLIVDYHLPFLANYVVDTCEFYFWPQNGVTYYNSGIYFDTLQSSLGADSIVSLDLTIGQPSYSEITVETCDSYYWPATDELLTQSGDYKASLFTSSGCDSTIMLQLTINDGFYDTSYVTTCGSYLWPQNGLNYTSSGTFSASHQTANGCDSIYVIILDINTLEITSQPTDQFGNLGNMVQFNTDVNQTSALFQWQINNGNGFVDLNDTGQFIGSYTSTLYIQNINLDNHEQAFRCIIDYQNCHLISYPAFLYIKEVGIEDNQANTFSIYPNPTENFFTVKCNISAGERLLTSILNSTGQKIYSQNYNIDKDGELQIDASWLPSGIYFIQLNFGQNQITKKLIIQ